MVNFTLLSNVVLDQTKLNAWVLDGDLIFVPFLKFALDKKNFTDRMVVIVVDMDRPWNIMDALEKWSNALEDYIQSIDVEVEDMKEYQDNRKLGTGFVTAGDLRQLF